MHTLRARASVPPTAATSRPVAADSALDADRQQREPDPRPADRDAEHQRPNANVTSTCKNAIDAVEVALPSSTAHSGTGAARSRSHRLRCRSRSSSSPLSMPQNSRYCRVIPQKLCVYELNAAWPAPVTASASTANGSDTAPSPPVHGASRSRGEPPHDHLGDDALGPLPLALGERVVPDLRPAAVRRTGPASSRQPLEPVGEDDRDARPAVGDAAPRPPARTTTSASTRGLASRSATTCRVNGPSSSATTSSGSRGRRSGPAPCAKIRPNADASTTGTAKHKRGGPAVGQEQPPVLRGQGEDQARAWGAWHGPPRRAAPT